LGERLSQLSEEQIRDCFRAGGYDQEEVEGYSTVISKSNRGIECVVRQSAVHARWERYQH